MRKTKRAQAFDNYKKILEALEEHSNEAQKEGNTEWYEYLQRILNGMYAAEIPDKSGMILVRINLKD